MQPHLRRWRLIPEGIRRGLTLIFLHSLIFSLIYHLCKALVIANQVIYKIKFRQLVRLYMIYHGFCPNYLYLFKLFFIDNFIKTFVVLILPINGKIYIFNLYHAAIFKISNRLYLFTSQR